MSTKTKRPNRESKAEGGNEKWRALSDVCADNLQWHSSTDALLDTLAREQLAGYDRRRVQEIGTCVICERPIRVNDSRIADGFAVVHYACILESRKRGNLNAVIRDRFNELQAQLYKIRHASDRLQ